MQIGNKYHCHHCHCHCSELPLFPIYHFTQFPKSSTCQCQNVCNNFLKNNYIAMTENVVRGHQSEEKPSLFHFP